MPGEAPLTLREVATMLDLSYPTIRTYVTRYRAEGAHPRFPDPADEVSGQPLFDPQEMLDWDERRRTSHRRTRKKPAPAAPVDFTKFVDRAGAAELLDVEPTTITRYALRDTDFSADFPDPARTIGRTRYWSKEDLLTWKSTHVGTGGAPSKRSRARATDSDS